MVVSVRASASSPSPPSSGEVLPSGCTSQRAATVLVLMCLVRLLASLLLFVEATQFVLMLPSMLEGVCQHLLPISTGRYVCCTLPCSRDSWVWTPIGWPDQRSINDTLEVLDFYSMMGYLQGTSRLCNISSCCCFAGGCFANIQSRAASGDSSGGEQSASPDVSVTPGSASFKHPSNACSQA